MYTIEKLNESRLLVVPANEQHRWKFYNPDKTAVRFRRKDNKCYAIIGEQVLVYKKPNAHQFHKELMRENGLALYRGLPGCDSERLLENMLEFIEIA